MLCSLLRHLQVAGCLHDLVFCAGSAPCSGTIETWLLAYKFLMSQGLSTGVSSWVFPKLSAAAIYGRRLLRREAQDEPFLLHAIQQRNQDELLSRNRAIEFISSWQTGGHEQVSCFIQKQAPGIFEEQALPDQGQALLGCSGLPPCMHALCKSRGQT